MYVVHLGTNLTTHVLTELHCIFAQHLHDEDANFCVGMKLKSLNSLPCHLSALYSDTISSFNFTECFSMLHVSMEYNYLLMYQKLPKV
jgi:hypothetical protein